MAPEQLLGHIAVVIKIPDVCGRKPQQLCRRVALQQLLHRPAPFPRAAAVEFVQDDIVGRQQADFFLRHCGKFGIGAKTDVLHGEIRAATPQALALGAEDILAGREPEKHGRGVVLHQLESDIAFSGAGGMNDSSLSGVGKQRDCGRVCFLVVRVQLHRHPAHLRFAIMAKYKLCVFLTIQ